jgi:hypothetical protein
MKKYLSIGFVLFTVLLSSNVFAATAGPSISGSAATNGGAGMAWSGASNINTAGAPYATIVLDDQPNANATSESINATNYGFSIPSGAIIDGIVVEVNRNSSSNNFGFGVNDNSVRLIKGGSIVGNNNAVAGTWGTSTSTVSYGGVSDKWGNTWTPADINASNFGVAFSIYNSSTIAPRTATLDYLKITVHYTLPDTTAPVISQITAVPAVANDTTPNYTFTTDEVGTITYGGSCSSATTAAIIGSNTITFNALAQGTYSDCTVKVTDASLNQSNVLAVNTFTIDTTAPVIDSVTTPVTVERTTSYTDVPPAATDTNDGSVTVIASGSVDTNTVGSYVLTYNATDAAGNAATPVTKTVDVVDTTAPTISNITSSDANGAYGDTDFLTINVVLSEIVNVNGGVPTLTLNAPGIATYTGGTGSNTLSFQYTVQTGDNNGDLNVNSVNLSGATIKDGSLNAANLALPSGNNLSDNKDLVIDTEAPVLTAPATQTFEATGPSTTPTLNPATAVDNLDGTPTIIPDTTTFSLGNTTVTWTATDDAGNSSTITSEVVIEDTTAPTLLLVDNPFELWVNDTYSEPGYTATDLVDGDVTPGVLEISNDLDNANIGTYHITYEVSDSNSNSTQVTREIHVIDTIRPIIHRTGVSPVTVEAGSTYDDEGATAEDQNGDDITNLITTTGLPVNTLVLGDVVITYDVIGNVSSTSATTAHRTVTVVDTTAPVITITGDNPKNLKVGDPTYTDEGAVANDIIDGMTPLTGTPGTVDTTVAGTFTVTYSITDAHGNSSTATRDVVVRELGTDATLSELSASAGVLTPTFDSGTENYTALVPFGTTTNPDVFATTTDSNATFVLTPVSDITSPILADRTATIEVTAEDGIVTKTYTIVFTVADAPDTEAPVITLLGDAVINIVEDSTYTEQGATVTDNIDSGLVATTTGSVDTNVVGVYAIRYNAEDTAGNHAIEVTRTVNVIEKTSTGGGSGSRPSSSNGTASSTGQVLGASTDEAFKFLKDMRQGSSIAPDVSELQKRLRAEGFFTFPTNTGYFGPITFAAVKAYQAAHPEIGYVTGFCGPLTRGVLNR